MRYLEALRPAFVVLACAASAGAAGHPAAGGAPRVYAMHARALGVFGGVPVRGDGFGSAIAPVPGHPNELYGLSDRGPNAEGPTPDSKIFPVTGYAPAIGRFRLAGGEARLVRTIVLRDERGAPLGGLVPPAGEGNTGESALDGAGRPLAPRAGGIDPEGLVALADGTFWVSEEYGPSLLHFAANGKLIERVTPFAPNSHGHRLPAHLARRVPNRGIEGLTITPDGTTLVALMQSALANDVTESEAKKTPALRLVTYTIATGATREYVYLLADPAATGALTSDITALSATEFLVVEQDIHFPGPTTKLKAVFEISLAGATDVSAPVRTGDRLDGARGILFGGDATLERVTKASTTADARAALAARGVAPVGKKLRFDINKFLLGVDAKGGFFAHDKIEGIAVMGGGRSLVLVNDCDFGVGPTSPPSAKAASKMVPATGRQDAGEILIVDLPPAER